MLYCVCCIKLAYASIFDIIVKCNMNCVSEICRQRNVLLTGAEECRGSGTVGRSAD